jgi:Fungal specific transcription factor domain
LFKDETEYTKKRLQIDVQSNQEDDVIWPIASKDTSTERDASPMTETDFLHSSFSKSPSIVEIACQHFFRTILPGSSYEYLPDMISDGSSSSQCLISAIQAVALANIASERKDGQLMEYSKFVHVKAVRQVNQALKSSKEITRDSTLVATLVLGTFEALLLIDERSSFVNRCFKNWVAHSNGTLSLIRFRGREFLRTEFGKRAYFFVTNKVRMNCFFLGLRLPPEIIELDKSMIPAVEDTDDLAIRIRFLRSAGMMNELMARIRGNY